MSFVIYLGQTDSLEVRVHLHTHSTDLLPEQLKIPQEETQAMESNLFLGKPTAGLSL